MKFTVSSSLILKSLNKLSSVISSNPVLPLLEDFLFVLDGNELTLTATDLDTSIQTKIEVMSEDKGMVAIPAKILLETLKALPQQPLTFNIDDSNLSVELVSSFGTYKLLGENGEEYPKLPEEENVSSLKTDTNSLMNGISKTIFAASNDDLRPNMMGVFFQIADGTLTLVATDAHKLVKFSLHEIDSDGTFSFIVPKKSLNALKGVLKEGQQVEITFNSSNAFFKLEDMIVISRLVDARYPDYNAVIPVNNPNILTVNRLDFLSALKRIGIYANKTTNQVILNINETKIVLSSQDLDFSNEASEELNCSYEGDSIDVAFNSKFVIEMLGVLETDEVILKLSTPRNAGILMPSENVANQEIIMIVMPVMLSNG